MGKIDCKALFRHRPGMEYYWHLPTLTFHLSPFWTKTLTVPLPKVLLLITLRYLQLTYSPSIRFIFPLQQRQRTTIGAKAKVEGVRDDDSRTFSKALESAETIPDPIPEESSTICTYEYKHAAPAYRRDRSRSLGIFNKSIGLCLHCIRSGSMNSNCSQHSHNC